MWGPRHVSLCLLLILMLFIGSSRSKSSFHHHDHHYMEPERKMQIFSDRVTCIGCVLIVSLVEQLAQVHNTSAQKAMESLCMYLPEQEGIRGVCILIAEFFGPNLIKLLNNRLNPDVICHAVKLCKTEPDQPICHLYKKPVQNSEVVSGVLFKICSFPLFKKICETIESSVPAEDYDQDYFSAFPSLRGYHWRGRDCNDIDKSIYPGRSPEDWDAFHDSNCNGIWGFDPEDGIPYEKKLCEGTDAKGIVVLGDSAAAHFHIPPEWITTMNMSRNSFSNMALAISNELDWPQFSLYTGFENSTIGGWTQSLYLRLRDWNRCNHRDYQNIARNGGAFDNLQDYIKSLARNQQLDKPVVVFYALIGNDVCNPHPDTLKHMTTPQKLKANVLMELNYLDTHVPNGSHVILMSLVDGRLVWDTLHDKYHPIGELNKDVTYAQYYKFMSCLTSNPCEGWMNRNETLRNLTTERAEQLSSALQEIAATKNFNHFKVTYFENLYQKVIAKWKRLGGNAWDLLEPVDGFHPNQISSAVGADLIWEEVLQRWPGVFGKQNPFNQEIIAKFGDQGGH
ncbi:acyloxyacyl hydrolase isoform X2 [Pseudophryne corroboree]|uniref:acyloxyacyl hydrolase isoform X2 n=1 Tax=Pseudophryne corroboree TaxID=495146 RepID=UPI0030821893